jgi:histidine ammonia-lyase
LSEEGPQLVLDGNSLTLEALFDLIEQDSWNVGLAPAARQAAAASSAQVGRWVDEGKPIYGLTRGLGPLKDVVLTLADELEFQERVLLSHSTGIGPPFCDEIARLAMVIRANAASRGHFGIRPELIERILEVLNAGVVPTMPMTGSLGSGDLQPMASLGLVITGHEHGRATFAGEPGPAPGILARAGVEPEFRLGLEEALSIISGSTVLAAGIVYSLHRIRNLYRLMDAAYALTMEALRGEVGALDERVHDNRRIPGQIDAARAMRALLARSEWCTDEGRARLGEKEPRVQDAVSLRSSPHIHGALRETWTLAATATEREVNASTMNPLVFPDPSKEDGWDVVMGGNYDGSWMAHQLDYLNIALTDAAGLSQSRAARLISRRASYGLPQNLVGGRPGIDSGMVQVQSLQLSLLGQMRQLADPASTHSLSAKDMYEDHNSMGNSSLCDVLTNLDTADAIVGIELLLAAQAIDLIRDQMDKLALGKGTAAVHAVIREHVAPLRHDRHLGEDVEEAVEFTRGPELLDAVLACTGEGSRRRG